MDREMNKIYLYVLKHGETVANSYYMMDMMHKIRVNLRVEADYAPVYRRRVYLQGLFI